MRYANIRPHADQMSGVAMFRPVAVLGEQFARQHDPVGFERQVAARKLELAHFTLEQAESAYAASRADLGELNHRRRRDRHDRAITSDRVLARMLRETFGTMNRRRGAMIRARKALAAAEAAVAKLVPAPVQQAAEPQQRWFERRINALTGQKHAALRDAAAARQHAAELQAKLDQMHGVAA